MAKKVTGSAAMVGYVGAAETLPYLLLGPYSGVLADRLDRKRLMLASDLASGLILLLFAAFLLRVDGKPSATWLLAIPLLISVSRVFFLPAKSAAIPNLVPAEKLALANAMSAVTQSVAPMVSLAVSAGVLAFLYDHSPSTCFAGAAIFNGLSFLVSALYIRRLPQLKTQRQVLEKPKFLVELKEGIAYVMGNRILGLLLLLQAGFSVFVAPFWVVFVVVNDQWFGGKPATLTMLELSFFVGMVIGNAWVGRLHIRKPGLSFIWSMVSLGGSVILMAYSPLIGPFMLLNMLAGVVLPFADLPLMLWKQVTIPDEVRGRVNSLETILRSGLNPLAMVGGGLLVESIGVGNSFWIMGGGLAVVGLAGFAIRGFSGLIVEAPVANEAAPPSDSSAEGVPCAP